MFDIVTFFSYVNLLIANVNKMLQIQAAVLHVPVLRWSDCQPILQQIPQPYGLLFVVQG